MRVSLAREFGESIAFVGVLEFHKSGIAHLHLLVGKYIRDFRDILGLQDQVAKAIAGGVRVKLTPQEEMHLTNVRRVDPQVQDAYLTGRVDEPIALARVSVRCPIFFQ